MPTEQPVGGVRGGAAPAHPCRMTTYRIASELATHRTARAT
jgi:hypothetical protein